MKILWRQVLLDQYHSYVLKYWRNAYIFQRNFSFSSRQYLSEEQIPTVANLEHPSGRCTYIFVRCTNKVMFSLANSVKLNLSSLNAQEVSHKFVKL